MDFTNRQSLIPSHDIQYLQAAAMMAIQQKLKNSLLPMQIQQNLLFANLLRQKESLVLSQTEQAMRRLMDTYRQQQM